MGITESTQKISETLNRSIHDRFRQFSLFILKFFSSLVIAYSISLVGSQLMNYGNLSALFVTILFTTAFLRLMKDWSFSKILVFDFIIVLIGLCLKMYIMIAP